MDPEIKAALDALKSTFEGEFKTRHEQVEAEVKQYGKASQEAVEALARVEARMDEFEAKAAAINTATEKVEGEEYVKAFWHSARTGDKLAVKDMTVGNDPQAGILVPDTFLTELLKGVREFSPIQPLVRVANIGGGSLKVPKRTGTMTATERGEVAAITETNLTVGLEEISVHEVAAAVDVSNTLLMDSVFDVEGWIREEAAEAFGVKEGAHLVSGTGVGQPEGFLNGGISTVNTATNDTLVADDLIELFYTVKTAYANNGTWLLNRGIIKHIRKMKGSDNNYLWQPGIAGSAPATILDRPYVEVPDMDSTVADAKKVAAFGDWRRCYMMVNRMGMNMQRDPYTQADNGLTRFRFWRQYGGQVVNPDAARILVVA